MKKRLALIIEAQGAFFPYYSCLISLKLCVPWGSGERNNVADVLHASDEEDKALEAEAKASMRTAAVLAGVKVPPKM